MGSCLPMLIQMPILFALYRVIYNIPAYVAGVKEYFEPLAEKILTIDGGREFLGEFATANRIDFEKLGYTKEAIIDCLYKFKPDNWSAMLADSKFTDITSIIERTQSSVDQMNNFLGINIADSPWNMLQSSMVETISIIGIIIALIIPVLAGLTQWFQMKLTQTATASPVADGAAGDMANSMKTMNNVMPVMSVFFCFTLPAGMGLYWIAGAVVRSIQQVIINKQIDNLDIDEVLEKNAKKSLEKENRKREKMGLPPQSITNQAKVNVKNIKAVDTTTPPDKKKLTEEDKKAQIEKATDYYKNTEAKPGSIASKARMVQKYNEKKKN